MKPARVVIILANLGTPDAPTPAAVRRFLAQFLSDRRVIEIPAFVWQIILRLFILPFRPRRVAHAYASIWQGDSPMRAILQEQVKGVADLLQQDQRLQGAHVEVVAAMTYGQPGLRDVLAQLSQAPPDHIVLLPLFPQYSATSTAPLYDVLARWIPTQRHLPGLTVVRDYFGQPQFIAALAATVRRFQAQQGQPERLLMSFHGIPQPYADKGDPYAERCHQTAQALASALGLPDGAWAISFQSRFGKQEWVKPYTSELLQQWGRDGVRSVQVISPAFSADCLETLEELAIENRDVFLQAGGQSYEYIPALNVEPEHIVCLADIAAAHVAAVLHSLPAQ